MAPARARSGTGRDRWSQRASGTLHPDRAGRARRHPRGGRRASRRRPSRGARPRSAPSSRGARPDGGTEAARAARRPPAEQPPSSPRAPRYRQPAVTTAARGARAANAANAAVRAEPPGIGSAGARDPLAREVKLLGALLGQVIVEQAREELVEIVERTRRGAIALRQG